MKSPEQSAQLWLGGRRGTLHVSRLRGRRGELGSLAAGAGSGGGYRRPRCPVGLSLDTGGPAVGAVPGTGWQR